MTSEWPVGDPIGPTVGTKPAGGKLIGLRPTQAHERNGPSPGRGRNSDNRSLLAVNHRGERLMRRKDHYAALCTSPFAFGTDTRFLG